VKRHTLWLWLVLAAVAAGAQPVDLLKRYPTRLTVGDANPDHARPWVFTERDIYRVSRFSLVVGEELRVELGAADLGIGHCADSACPPTSTTTNVGSGELGAGSDSDGAVWAVLIPREGGSLTSRANIQMESIAHVWLRFHPKEINRLFPPQTVSADGARNLAGQLRLIANAKFTSSWHAGANAMIPEPNEMTVDVDTQRGLRRFFAVDTEAASARYVAAFENRPMKQSPAIKSSSAEEAFDTLWQAFDRDYAMFALHPEVDWAALRDKYRPKALSSKSTPEFAAVCADMLKSLRDLHVWLTLAGANVPVFNRPRSANSNPSAHAAILGDLRKESGGIQWAITPDQIGFIAIYGWSDRSIPAQCDEVLEHMRETRGLIVDVRLNGGGSENLAREFAGRFLQKEFVYAYSRFRNGPEHPDLTEKYERRAAPRDLWRYDRPVVLLIGQKCMSSNESFIAMMSGATNVTIMGDHTCGSSGNPRIVKLPLDMTVSVPRWIDYLPDGTPLDERGFQPQVPFKPQPGAFQGERDDLLSAALERLRQSPPTKP